MLTHRIIPCLDIKDGQTVKGTHFVNIRHAGDPLELAQRYVLQGADELTFLDISATQEQRATFSGLVRRIARKINIPFTVGGGIRSVADVSRLLDAGADKVSVNSAALQRPDLIDDIAKNFGSQCLVLAIDTKRVEDADQVFVHGGTKPARKITQQWARETVERGAGEIMLTSIDHDGVRNGFALGITRELATNLPVPVIASGGAGTFEHFRDIFLEAGAEAALAAGIFHFDEMRINQLKEYLYKQKVAVRI